MIDVQDAVEALLLRVAHEIEAEAKETAPKVEGDLVRDIQVFMDDLANLEVSIGNSKLIEYAPFVHGGVFPAHAGMNRYRKTRANPTQPCSPRMRG